MSTTPWLLKGASGKLGNIVLSNGANGGTARMHVEHIRQPRTASQMTQRARFANVVNFFKSGNQNFFKFAFEDKKPKESDYNAFVRHNAKASLILPYDNVQSPNYPALGNRFLMTNGSLAYTESTVDNDRVILKVQGMTGNEANWGAVCEKIIAAFPALQNGDFITCVGILSYTSSFAIPNYPVVWDIHQFTINTNSTAEIPDLLSVAADKLTYETVTSADDMSFGCICFSRKTSGGTKVSTTYLENNSVAQNVIENAGDGENIDYALSTWKSAGDAILQGSLSDQ